MSIIGPACSLRSYLKNNLNPIDDYIKYLDDEKHGFSPHNCIEDKLLLLKILHNEIFLLINSLVDS